MPHFTSRQSRRHFVKSTFMAAIVASSSASQTKPEKSNIPYVDGLCPNIFNKPEDIRASGLTSLLADVSAGEMVKSSDGSQRFQRTFKDWLSADGSIESAPSVATTMRPSSSSTKAASAG